uniref:Uncharacterized protein n=1 Tax=Sphaerodactylus townsendi TaxID=933632 RepID=A0ACB8EVP2_9SAUR
MWSSVQYHPKPEEKGKAIQREAAGFQGCPGDALLREVDFGYSGALWNCLDTCLVNNAGDESRDFRTVRPRIDKIDDVTAQDVRNVMELNTLSILLASKYALPYLRETRGNIINMASIIGVIGLKNRVTYSLSKGAIIAMTKTLAIDESKYGVRVNW